MGIICRLITNARPASGLILHFACYCGLIFKERDKPASLFEWAAIRSGS